MDHRRVGFAGGTTLEISRYLTVLAAILLVGALGSHPYGYYQFLRWFVAPLAAYLAFRFQATRRFERAWMWGVVAVFFNPVFPIALVRSTWNAIDLLVAVLFIGLGGVTNAQPTPDLSNRRTDVT